MNLLKKMLSLLIFIPVFFCTNAHSEPSSEIYTTQNNIVYKQDIKRAIDPSVSYSLTISLTNAENNELKEGYTAIVEANVTPVVPEDTDLSYRWVINGKVLDSSSGTTDEYSWNTIDNILTITAIANSGSLNVVCSVSESSNPDISIAQNAVVINLKQRNSTTSEIIESLLNNSTVIIFIIGLAATIISRTAIKIFRFGVNYKSNFSTVEQQKEFESATKEELRNIKNELQDSLLKSCMRAIDRETAPLKELKQIEEDVKSTKIKIDLQLKDIGEKYEDLRKMQDSVRDLEKRFNTIQYGDSEPSRRSGK